MADILSWCWWLLPPPGQAGRNKSTLLVSPGKNSTSSCLAGLVVVVVVVVVNPNTGTEFPAFGPGLPLSNSGWENSNFPFPGE